MTARSLDRMSQEYKIVIEPQEYDAYTSVINPNKIYVLPFSNLGQGSIPARNWVWEHAISIGAKRHWILDDNIDGFVRYNYNRKIRCYSPAIFKAAEDFVDRYENIALAGFNYRFMGGDTRMKNVPFRINTRIYSCILIDNKIQHRWRGRYNEDTDLSLRVLKDKCCTILFQAFLCNKQTTMSMKGGNTDELYQDDGRLKMAQSLCEQHPDCSKISWKFNRWQHHVDYKRFRNNKLKLKSGVIVPKGVNNYGMVLIENDGE